MSRGKAMEWLCVGVYHPSFHLRQPWDSHKTDDKFLDTPTPNTPSHQLIYWLWSAVKRTEIYTGPHRTSHFKTISGSSKAPRSAQHGLSLRSPNPTPHISVRVNCGGYGSRGASAGRAVRMWWRTGDWRTSNVALRQTATTTWLPSRCLHAPGTILSPSDSHF